MPKDLIKKYQRNLGFRITIYYIIFGIIWILFSDLLLSGVSENPDLYFFLGIVKGIGYVVVTGLFFLLIYYKLIKKMNDYELKWLQSQRIESIGQLTSGINHEFKNQLLVLRGFLDLIKIDNEYKNIPPSIQEYIKEIDNAVSKSVELTAQLLHYGKSDKEGSIILEINKIISEMIKFIEQILPSGIHIEFAPTSEPLFIRSSPLKIEQVLINLILNSRDAIYSKKNKDGRITIRTSKLDIHEFDKSFKLKGDPGTYIQISVKDTGIGIDEEEFKKIFSPFYSNKEECNGTGVGLMVVLNIVKEMNGCISVIGNPGSGAEFRIFLPELKL